MRFARGVLPLAATLVLTTGPARADGVGPPPERDDCPRGSVSRVADPMSHGQSAYCAPLLCRGGMRSPVPGVTCEIVELEIAARAHQAPFRGSLAAPPPPPPPDPPPPSPATGGSPRAQSTGGCACPTGPSRACALSPLALALAAVVAMCARRRSRHGGGTMQHARQRGS